MEEKEEDRGGEGGTRTSAMRMMTAMGMMTAMKMMNAMRMMTAMEMRKRSQVHQVKKGWSRNKENRCVWLRHIFTTGWIHWLAGLYGQVWAGTRYHHQNKVPLSKCCC